METEFVLDLIKLNSSGAFFLPSITIPSHDVNREQLAVLDIGGQANGMNGISRESSRTKR